MAGLVFLTEPGDEGGERRYIFPGFVYFEIEISLYLENLPKILIIHRE